MAIVFDRLGRWVFKNNEVQARAMYFFCGLLVYSWLLLLAGMAGVVRAEWVSRLPLLFIAAAILIVIAARSFQPIDLLMQPLKMTVNNRWDRITRLAIVITTGTLFFICLAPPTDADSLDYHLGVPVDMLKQGGLFFDAGNLHFRMFGFGEMLNLPGVAAGCPQLGAFIQLLAFRYLLRVYSDPVNGKTRLDLLVLCMGIPLVLFLVSGAKHQLTGVAATCIAFHALQHRDGLLRPPYIFLFWAVLVFAIGIKYSFVISAAAIVLLLILKDGRWSYLLKVILTGFATFAVFIGPLLVYKGIRFGDPLSPLLERFKSNPDPVVLDVQQFLNSFSDSTFPFPLNLLLPSSPGNITTIIGLGALVIVLFLFRPTFGREKLVIIFYVVITALMGQRTARFFLEPLLWVAPLFFATISYNKWQKVLVTGFRLQLLLMLPVLVLSFGLFSRGLFTDKGRDDVMRSYAVGYAESRWIDSLLPPEAKIAAGIRSRSLVPRQNFPVEYLTYSVRGGRRADTLAAMLQRYQVDYFVMPDYYISTLGPAFNMPPVACKEFTMATRNPLNKTTYTLCIYKAQP